MNMNVKWGRFLIVYANSKVRIYLGDIQKCLALINKAGIK